MYNCEKQISRVISQIKGDIVKYVNELIIVDNGSRDNSIQVALKAIKKCLVKASVRQNIKNYSLGGSHKIAFQYAVDNKFDYLIVFHGDAQGDIADIVPMLESRRFENVDMTLGARFMKGSRLIGYSKFRTFGNIVYNILFSLAFFCLIYDLGSGLNMYKVNALEGCWWYKLPDKLSFNYAMLMAANTLRKSLLFFPITWREDDQVSNVKMTRQAFEVLWMLIKYFFKRDEFIFGELRQKQIIKYDSEIVGDNR
jgi:glycosyltransferase involved in cell wall biosynthesis